jgi:hypothetical protein
MSIDGTRNPVVATSFGTNAPQSAPSAAYDDHVDFSRPTAVAHDGFTLTYPATWFLRLQPQEEGSWERLHRAVVGGNTGALTLSVRLRSGTSEDLLRERQAILERMSRPQDSPNGRLTPRAAPTFALQEGAQGLALDFASPAIEGFSYGGVFTPAALDRLAQVSLFGCVSRGNPRRPAILTDMDRAARAVLESFHLT